MIININNLELNVVNHWFWDEFKNKKWEPTTYDIMKKYLKSDKNYLDIGTWVGPTVFYAIEIGVNMIYGIEANPVTSLMLKRSCEQNVETINKLKLYNLCVTNSSDDLVKFGPTNGVIDSSACSVRGDRWKVYSTRIVDWIRNNDITNYNFIKIDIEGSEQFITDDLNTLSDNEDLVILLSLHPEFWTSRKEASKQIVSACEMYDIYDSNQDVLTRKELVKRMTYEGINPSWGSPMGNFFEILLKSKN
jgi:FkbM family methyltransferase